jgi:hypothetical protein
MSDSTPSVFDKAKPFLRIAALLGGVVLLGWGTVVGAWMEDWSKGTFLLVAGAISIHGSELGRPVFINIWNQVAEAKSSRGDHNQGYL